MVAEIIDGIDVNLEDYSDETEAAVRRFVDIHHGRGLCRLILDSTDSNTDHLRVACLFDILIWFPGVDILDFVTELRSRLDAGDERTLRYVSAMDAGVPDADDPLCWILQTFPELEFLRPRPHLKDSESN